MSKFHLYCSCLGCHSKMTIQNLSSHYESKHVQQVKSVKSKCPQCGTCILNSNKFCSRSCSAIYSNARKDYTVCIPGPKKGTPGKRTKTVCAVSPCVVCCKFHPGGKQTCSGECLTLLLSQQMKARIHAGFNPKHNRGRGKKSWLEQSFTDWLNEHQVINYETEKPFKRLDMIKTYFADFYFPDKKLIIELDGTQHSQTIEYDYDRDKYITDTYGVSILRISHQEYKNNLKTELVKTLLNIH